jgi:hypothetical protein
MHYFDSLQRQTQEASHGMIRFITDHPLAAKGLFGIGFFLELFCFIALWNRPMLAFFGLGLWGMHHSISSVMGLGFAFNKAILLIFFVNIPFWIYLATTKLKR